MSCYSIYLNSTIPDRTVFAGIAVFLVMLYHYATTAAFPGFHLAELRKGNLCVDLFSR